MMQVPLDTNVTASLSLVELLGLSLLVFKRSNLVILGRVIRRHKFKQGPGGGVATGFEEKHTRMALGKNTIRRGLECRRSRDLM